MPSLACLALLAASVLGAPAQTAESALAAGFDALNAERYGEATRLFVTVAERFPRAAAAADAYYWGAFASYRLGTAPGLREAARLLDLQRQRYPAAPTRADAAALTLRVAGALARGGDATARELLRRHAETLPGDCDTPTGVAALDELRTVDPGSTLPIAKAIMARTDCDATLRRRAAFLLTQGRGPEIEALLVRAARSDPDEEVRRLSIYGLAQVRTPAAVVSLTEMLAPAVPPDAQVQVVLALADVGNAAAQAALRRAAGDGLLSFPAREEAIFRLGQRGDNTAFLRDLFARLTEDALRRRVLFSLSQKRGDGNDAWLLSQARAERHPLPLRQYAVFAAGEAQAPTESLAELYRQVSERELRLQVIDVLGARREARSMQWTTEVAARDPQAWARERAQFWLEKSGRKR